MTKDWPSHSTHVQEMASVDWSSGDWNAPSFQAKKQIEYSDCWDLVEVPGGSDWHVRRLQDDKPSFCWRYPDISSSIQFHHQTVATAENSSFEEYSDLAPSGQSTASIPLFYAVTTHCYSPLDFCVQPKYLQRNRLSLERELQESYEFETPLFKPDELFEGVPCAACINDGRDGSVWVRAKVLQLTNPTTTFVRLVDKGTDVILPQAALRPLFRRLGKLPPLAMKCKLKGVFSNDLEMHKINLFQQMLSSYGNCVRVELASTCEPFHVNVYHPTVVGENVGSPFYRPQESIGHEIAKQRRFEEHLRRMDNEESDFDDDDFSDYDEEEKEIPKEKFAKEVERADRIYRIFDNQFVAGHVESSRMISLHTKTQLTNRDECEKKLQERLPTLPKLPLSWLVPGTSCVVTCLSHGRRAILEEVMEGGQCRVLLMDYGSTVIVHRECLYALPEELSEKPHMLVVGLYNSTCFLHPHPTFTQVLKEILATPGRISFELERGKNNPPRGRITHETFGEVSKEAKTRLSHLPSHRRFIHPCTDVAIPSPIAPLLYHTIQKGYYHRLCVPAPILKGNLTVEELPE
ncbi:hypothetical protein PRIPAC_82329 [Pristionchus pacificus]|uniref:Uncharacterized protein n=1 Tax=Pristionchus pacificus TaxID=54126 RepID=A0A2A6CAV4_PRIPA|nr:hypothetical protein PRIPAC_82329 [Pristionchus pacificus]|eukprot:PDM75230.1 hypothetical protein PRIPAC_43424 [Pristionchus pacificus]